MGNEYLEARLVRLERRVTIIGRVVVSIVSAAVTAGAALMVDRLTGSVALTIVTAAATVLTSTWVMRRDLLPIG